MTTVAFYRIQSFGRALSLTLLLFAGWSIASVSATPVPAKGTEILWDRYGIPHFPRQNTPIGRLGNPLSGNTRNPESRCKSGV